MSTAAAVHDEGYNPREFMAFSEGSRLGPYEILAVIGEGGMGRVYRARDTKLHRKVAIKVLPDSVAHDLGASSRINPTSQADPRC